MCVGCDCKGCDVIVVVVPQTFCSHPVLTTAEDKYRTAKRVCMGDAPLRGLLPPVAELITVRFYFSGL